MNRHTARIRARAIERHPKTKPNDGYPTTSDSRVITTTEITTNETPNHNFADDGGPFEAGYGFSCRLHGKNIISTTVLRSYSTSLTLINANGQTVCKPWTSCGGPRSTFVSECSISTVRALRFWSRDVYDFACILSFRDVWIQISFSYKNAYCFGFSAGFRRSSYGYEISRE